MVRLLRQRWSALSGRRRAHLIALVVLAIATLVHQYLLWHWYLEDAAISFAYAKHLAWGEGLVPYIGGERIEGYSNPLWVFLLTPWYWVGIDGFLSSKLMAGAFSVVTLVTVYAIAREARPHSDDEVPLLAAGVAAASAQFAIWNAGGLENGLFSMLLALGIWRTLVEARQGGWPWGALAFFGLAITRPEGILYAAFGGAWYAVLVFRDRGNIWGIAKWLLTFFVPFGLYHALRYWYFAWEFPNTYYAKLGHKSASPWSWHARCWKYTRQWSHELWHGYFLPLYVVGLMGVRSWRRWVALVAIVLLGVVLLYPGTESMKDAFEWWPRIRQPSWWVQLRVLTLVSLASLLPVLAVGRRGWRSLVMCWGMAIISLYFSWWSTGDWSKGFRWMSLLVVPTSVLLASGMGEVADGAQRLRSRQWRSWRVTGWVVAGLLFALVLPPNINHTAWFIRRPETGPHKVKKRVDYMTHVRKRLHLDLFDPRVINFDVDMGANVYWAPPDTVIMDMAGLLDIPMAQHHFEKPFMKEYVFEEMKPHFVHSHGGWARSSKIQTHPEWDRYFEIPGYPQSKRVLHTGNWVRKDTFARPTWEGTPGRRVELEDELVIEGWEVPTPTTAPGRHLYVEVALSSRERREGEEVRVLLFLADDQGHLATWDVPPGYDWYEQYEWQAHEVVFTRLSVPIPEDLPEGTYDLGLLALANDGHVLLPAEPDPQVSLAHGEVRWADVVEVMPRDELAALAQADVDQARDSASRGRCEEAEGYWRRARMRHTRAARWLAEREQPLRTDMASCWVALAEGETLANRVDDLERARLLDHHHAGLLQARRGVVEVLLQEGQRAQEQGDWETAYHAFADVLRVQPTHSWARRWAEEARDHRLGLDPETKAQEEAARQERLERARERRKEREESEEPVTPGTPRVPLQRKLVPSTPPTPKLRPEPDAPEEAP